MECKRNEVRNLWREAFFLALDSTCLASRSPFPISRASTIPHTCQQEAHANGRDLRFFLMVSKFPLAPPLWSYPQPPTRSRRALVPRVLHSFLPRDAAHDP